MALLDIHGVSVRFGGLMAVDTVSLAAEAGRVTRERVNPGVQVMLQHQNERGRWSLVRNHSDRLLVVAEETGPESKWSTLNALRVLSATEIM